MLLYLLHFVIELFFLFLELEEEIVIFLAVLALGSFYLLFVLFSQIILVFFLRFYLFSQQTHTLLIPLCFIYGMLIQRMFLLFQLDTLFLFFLQGVFEISQ